MKKFFTALLSIFTACLLALTCTGCSGCGGETVLSFNDMFFGMENSSPSLGYVETAYYDVNYQKSFGTDFVRDKDVTDDIVTMNITGSYQTKLEVTNVSVFNEQTEFLSQTVKSNLISGYQNENIYKLTNKLDLVAKYSLKGGAEETYNDHIYSVIYFAPGKLSFTPIYTEQDAEYTVVAMGDEGVAIGKFTNQCSVSYAKESYTIKSKHFKDGSLVQNQTKKYENQSGTVIDNAQLLFTMRNIDITTSELYDLGVVSYQYGEIKTIRIGCDAVRDEIIPPQNALTVNGSPFIDNDATDGESKIKLKRYSYRIAGTTHTGISQLVFVQSENTGNLGNRRFIYKYVEPVSAFSSNALLGAMVYTLRNVTFGYKI